MTSAVFRLSSLRKSISCFGRWSRSCSNGLLMRSGRPISHLLVAMSLSGSITAHTGISINQTAKAVKSGAMSVLPRSQTELKPPGAKRTIIRTSERWLRR